MKTYLRIINPIVASVIFLLCLYAATVNEGNFEPSVLIKGGIPTYFLAKGLFCSLALLIIGKILSIMIERTENK